MDQAREEALREIHLVQLETAIMDGDLQSNSFRRHMPRHFSVAVLQSGSLTVENQNMIGAWGSRASVYAWSRVEPQASRHIAAGVYQF